MHLIPSADAVGVNGTQGLNVHTIAVQVPITDLTRGNQRPTDVMGARSVIGIWASASRQRSRILDERTGRWEGHGPFRQVSRLGNPLFNEVIVPMARKDRWNHLDPDDDKAFATYVLHPELAGLLPVLYPGVFPNLAAYTKPRADLAAVLLTGIPSGVVPGFQNFTGTVQADMLRLNVAVPPTEPAKANPLGLIGGDAAGFPNGRRVFDDVVTVELRAVAGATIPLVDPSFTPDGAATVIKDGTSNTNAPYLPAFPLPRQPRPVATRPPPACPPPEVPDAARRPQPAGQGHVLLDIGGSIGALLVHMPAAMAGDEIEATPTGASAPPQHVAVIARRAGEHVAHIAVFPALPEGTYQVHRKPDGPVRLHTTVEGGRITETRWPENNQH